VSGSASISVAQDARPSRPYRIGFAGDWWCQRAFRPLLISPGQTMQPLDLGRLESGSMERIVDGQADPHSRHQITDGLCRALTLHRDAPGLPLAVSRFACGLAEPDADVGPTRMPDLRPA
jgi:hypothetical protein